MGLKSFHLWLLTAGVLTVGLSPATWAIPIEPATKPDAPTVTDRIAQVSPAQVTGIKLNPTPEGLEILLETRGGATSLVQTTQTERGFVTEITNAQLSLPSGKSFRQKNPTPDIAAVTVTPLAQNRIRVLVTGTAGVPTGQVLVRGEQGLVVKVDASTTATIPPPNPQADDLEPIELVVTAERESETGYQVEQATTATEFDAPLRDIPRSIQVVPEQVIEDQKAIRLEDALRNVSGVSRDNTFGGTADGFNVRGFAADIFRDGFPEVPGTSSFSSLRETANLERAEVLKGPSSILFGNVSPGGIINLVTKKPLADPFYAGSFTIGNFSLYRPTLDISGPLSANESLLYRLNAVYENSSSFRDFTGIERVFVAPVLAWKISDRTAFSLELDYLNDEHPFDRGIVAIGDRPADIPISRRLGEPGDVRRVEDLGVGYRFEHQINENWTLKNGFRALLSDNFTQRFEPRSLDEATGILDREFRIVDGDRQNYNLQTNLIGKFATGPVKHQAVFGLDLSRVLFSEIGFRERPTTPINIFNPVYGAPIPDAPLSFDIDSRSDNLGLYIQDLISLRDDLKLLVGGRFDVVDQENTDNIDISTTDQNDTAFSPTVGLVYQPIQPISLYTSFTQSFQPNFAIAADGSFLEPERGTQYEVGIKGEILKDRLFSTLAFYRLTKSNVGVLDPANPDFSIPIGEQRSQGIELDIVGRILPGWNIIASYTYTDAEILEGDLFAPTGNSLINIPDHSASLWTTYEIPKGDLQGLGFGLGLFYIGDRPGDLENTFILPDYLRTDAAVYYRRDNWRLAFNVKNLFDIRYFESSGFGRERITPGAPVTFLETISVEF